jgi:hypothetical protein
MRNAPLNEISGGAYTSAIAIAFATATTNTTTAMGGNETS